MQVWLLGREDPLEQEIALHSSILAWKIPRAEKQKSTVHGVQRLRCNWASEHSKKYETKSLPEYTFWLDQYPDTAETREHLHPKMYLQA